MRDFTMEMNLIEINQSQKMLFSNMFNKYKYTFMEHFLKDASFINLDLHWKLELHGKII